MAPPRPALVEAPVEPAPDGRRQRRTRNRDAVVEALLAMIDAGNLDPTIAEVAEASGLSARSVFRYFDDVDDLVRSAVRRQQERLAPLVDTPVDPAEPLDDRVSAFVGRRIELLEAMGNVGRLARMRAPVQPLVADELSRIRGVLAHQVATAFPSELGQGTERRRRLAAVDVLCSFEAYEAMRRDHELSRAEAIDAIAGAVGTLLSGSPR